MYERKFAAMVETKDHFTNRLSKLGKKHARLAQGYTTKVTNDGLLVATPKRRRVLPSTGVLKLVMLMLIGFLSFKSFTLAAVGPVTYNERIAKLEKGTMIEKAGAKMLAVDPVTEAVASTVGPVMR